jgi:hypothetical protein
MRSYNTIGQMISRWRIVVVVITAFAFPAVATDRVEFFGALKERFAEGLGTNAVVVLCFIVVICALAAIAVRF